MRAFYFTKIDFIKTKQQLIMVPFIMLFVSIVMLRGSAGISNFGVLIVFAYTLFIALVFSTAPFGECRRKDEGFLLLLPAGTRDRVVGRFLYGISLQMFAVVICIICAGGYHVLGYKIGPVELYLCLIGLSLGILLMSAEYVFFYLFGENSATQMLSIARIVPGLCFYMGSVFVSGMLRDRPELAAGATEAAGNLLNVIVPVIVAASLTVCAAAISLCVRMIEKRDY